MKYRKKPVVVEACQIPSLNGDTRPFIEWAGKVGFDNEWADGDHHFAIPTLEGVMAAGPLDWIIRGVRGEFYPCKPDVFEQTYEQVDE